MVVDEDGDYTTPLVDDAECAYAYPENGVTLCAVEKAWAEGPRRPSATDLVPPLSDPLMRFSNGTVGLNYHRWSICEPARQCGKRLGIPVYKALREPIIRRFGEEFYKALEAAEEFIRTTIEQRHEMKNRHIIAAALLLLTTTTAATGPPRRPQTPVKIRCNDAALSLRQQIETLQRQLPTGSNSIRTAPLKPALLSPIPGSRSSRFSTPTESPPSTRSQTATTPCR